MKLNADDKSFKSLLFLDGKAEIVSADGKAAAVKGDSFFVPAGSGEFTITGKCEVILSDII